VQIREKVFCVAGGPNKKSCTNSGDTPGIIACIVFRKICLYEGNGFVLLEDIGLTSTMKRILQEYGCARHILTRAAPLEQFTRF
jgi:hypothetical protein